MIHKLQWAGQRLGMAGIIFQSQLPNGKVPWERDSVGYDPCPFTEYLLVHGCEESSGVKKKFSEDALEIWHC